MWMVCDLPAWMTSHCLRNHSRNKPRTRAFSDGFELTADDQGGLK